MLVVALLHFEHIFSSAGAAADNGAGRLVASGAGAAGAGAAGGAGGAGCACAAGAGAARDAACAAAMRSSRRYGCSGCASAIARSLNGRYPVLFVSFFLPKGLGSTKGGGCAAPCGGGPQKNFILGSTPPKLALHNKSSR